MKVSGASDEQAEVLRSAPMALLDARAVTHNGERLAARLADELMAWEVDRGERKYSREKSRETLHKAIGSFLSDLLGARDAHGQGWVYRSMQAKAFTEKAVPRRTFGTLVECWKDCGLLEHRPGYKKVPKPWEPGEKVFRTKGFASRFRATQKLLDICAEYGITPETSVEHFRVVPPAHPLVLKASSTGSGRLKVSGKPMRFERTERSERLEKQVRELNEYFAQRVIHGGRHRYFTRIFNEGDQPGSQWKKGGRLYSEGEDCYQQMRRSERIKMTIDGEELCEIDIRASYLTIIHGLHRLPFPDPAESDPYTLEAFPRDVVKAWCVAVFGNKKRPSRWSSEAIQAFSEKHPGRRFRINEVRKAVCSKFPLLARWEDLPETWADLMFLESEAVIETMLALMRSNIPSLPVHDSLLVPVGAKRDAVNVLATNFEAKTGAAPALEVHHRCENLMEVIPRRPRGSSLRGAMAHVWDF